MKENGKREKTKVKSAKDRAWELFSATGKVSHYMLYKNLKDDKNE